MSITHQALYFILRLLLVVADRVVFSGANLSCKTAAKWWEEASDFADRMVKSGE